MNEPETPLSASRIKTAQSCSWLYWSKYKLSLPDASNDGARRGSICHLVFELLGEPKRKKMLTKMVKANDIFAVPAIERLVMKHCRKSGVDDEDNVSLIKDMTLNGLKYDFLGDTNGKPSEALSEKDFEIVVSSKHKKYKIKGFIDKLFLYKKSKSAIIRDFKSSKSVFQGKEVSDNLQDYMYSLAVRHLYPEYTSRISEFIFLKFELKNQEDMAGPVGRKKKAEPSGIVRMEPITEDDLDGFEYQLTEIQQYLDNFNESDARGNFAATQPFPADNSFSGPLQCGFAKFKGQLKKDGTPMWHCAMKFDFDYYVILNKDKKTIKSYTLEEFNDSLVPEGCYAEKRHYLGCPKHKK
jgi:hypothetical protein